MAESGDSIDMFPTGFPRELRALRLVYLSITDTMRRAALNSLLRHELLWINFGFKLEEDLISHKLTIIDLTRTPYN